MPELLQDCLSRNLTAVHTRIELACRRAGREPESAKLVAVTKYAPMAAVQGLVQLGHRVLGESRPQQLLERSREISAIEWHLIGHLQRNKVRAILPQVALIHSVDSIRLLERLQEIAQSMGIRPRVLLEVNVSGEPTKDGFSPPALKAVWEDIVEFTDVDVCGLMTMAPFDENPEHARPYFRHLRQLRDDLQGVTPACKLGELSMGMSGDFEVAIEEGATLVRIGSLLFEGCGDFVP